MVKECYKGSVKGVNEKMQTKDLNKRHMRKKEHIKYFLDSDHVKDNYFQDIFIENNSLPEIDFYEIDTKCSFIGKEIGFPMMINAITGGFEDAEKINKELALLAKKFSIPIAVGSQSIALRDKTFENSFKVVREVCKDGIVIANLSARSSLEDVQRAVEMIKADGIQLHLNAAQEIVMQEGDREFKGILKNIEMIINKLHKPVIIKEIGFGISKSTAEKLKGIGAKYIDISGRGGTNFIQIENERNRERDFTDLYGWGIPTALSLLQCCSVGDLNIICSGGISSSEEIVKSLCVGAKLVGISGAILRELMLSGYESTEVMLQDIIYKTKIIMLLTGTDKVSNLNKVPYKLKGTLKELNIQ